MFIHLSINRLLSCFHILVIVNNAFRNMSVQTFLQDPAFNSSGYILSGIISGSYVNSFFKRTTILFSTVAIKFYIPTNRPQRSNFCSFSPTLIFFLKTINKVMRVWLTYNVMWVSAVQQSETVTYVPTPSRFFSYIGHCRVLSKVLFLYRSLQSVE